MSRIQTARGVESSSETQSVKVPSPRFIAIGKGGVGRLLWLNVFTATSVSSFQYTKGAASGLLEMWQMLLYSLSYRKNDRGFSLYNKD